jgi:hypothetical protein
MLAEGATTAKRSRFSIYWQLFIKVIREGLARTIIQLKKQSGIKSVDHDRILSRALTHSVERPLSKGMLPKFGSNNESSIQLSLFDTLGSVVMYMLDDCKSFFNSIKLDSFSADEYWIEQTRAYQHCRVCFWNLIGISVCLKFIDWERQSSLVLL